MKRIDPPNKFEQKIRGDLLRIDTVQNDWRNLLMAMRRERLIIQALREDRMQAQQEGN